MGKVTECMHPFSIYENGNVSNPFNCRLDMITLPKVIVQVHSPHGIILHLYFKKLHIHSSGTISL